MIGAIQRSERSNGDYQSQKQCKKTSFAFYQAVRDLLPVWVLEDMRIMEVLHWEEGGQVSSYSPSEALLYALVHDHQTYAQYLLGRYPKEALAVPSKSFTCCQSSAHHLTMAIRYGRAGILRTILHTLRSFPHHIRLDYINRTGCDGVEGGKSPLHLACELHQADCLVLLLGHGARPTITDSTGNTPLDSLLQLIWESQRDLRHKRLCVESLLLFMPRVTVSVQLRDKMRSEPGVWQELIGPDYCSWISGASPPSLFALSMQSLLMALPAHRFPQALEELSLPDFLKPLPLRKL
ncbi:hypothetical protein GDO86_016075 [Hymenochirus boettgeri]|uniref:Ankyrin repeat domain-containing protein 9 n=1 Tax=Hymenochirus boettgeri TaxID=247094 RepID=A0A8T2JZS3_9PIPI|nr:hypothetical protein GDO86_016075 [Hymenochirus boettgeri]KAG8449264.1 hypothetical protein GDO86_016075 [Hymenochirus boettgeri]